MFVCHTEIDSVNVFVMNGADWSSCSIFLQIMDLLEMIMNELKFDKRTSCLRIEYIADVKMAQIRITKDSSLKLFMELKRKDSCLK